MEYQLQDPSEDRNPWEVRPYSRILWETTELERKAVGNLLRAGFWREWILEPVRLSTLRNAVSHPFPVSDEIEILCSLSVNGASLAGAIEGFAKDHPGADGAKFFAGAMKAVQWGYMHPARDWDERLTIAHASDCSYVPAVL